MLVRFSAVIACALALCFGGCDDDATSGSVASTTRTRESVTVAPLATPTIVSGRSCEPGNALADVFCADTAAMEQATVVDIVDGDTLDVIVGGREERVRIFGIDTPERGDRCFGEASDLLAALAGREIRMRTDDRTVDRNGRLLRYVYQPNGLSIDAVMIAAGMAHAWTRDGALRDPLVSLETEAREKRTGCLWG